MKKMISLVLAVLLVMSTGITAFAAEKKITSQALMDEVQGAVDYLAKDKYTLDDALELYYLVSSGAEVKNVDAFAKEVRDNLSANDGKLVTDKGETLTAYAAVIQILMNYDVGEELYDDILPLLLENFGKLDPTVLPESPYAYNVIIPASLMVLDEDFGKKLCDTMLENYYVKGSGMNYYGFSCDNTAFLISALSAYSDVYADVIEDCLTVLESYKVDGGYCFNPEFGTAPNGDSTALALMAYCSLYLNDLEGTFPKEKCDSIYNELTGFRGSKTGVYTYMNDGDNAFATADALRGIELYYVVVFIDELFSDIEDETEPDENVTEPTEEEEEPSSAEQTTKKEVAYTGKSKKSPATGSSLSAPAFSAALCAAALAVVLAKKKES